MNPTVSESRAGRTAPKPAGPKPPPRRRVRVAEGIYKDRHGLAATVKVNGIQREVRFPRGTPLRPSGRTATSCAPACGPSRPVGGIPSVTTPGGTSTR